MSKTRELRERIKRLGRGELFYLVILNLVVTADLGLDAPLIVKIVDHYGLTDFKFSLYVIIPFTLFSGIFSILWGYLSDQYNRRNILLLNLLLGSCCLLGVAVVFYFELPFAFAATLRVFSAIGLLALCL